MNDENKKYTLKSVQSEIVKFEKLIEKKKEKIAALTAEIKADTAKLKEFEKIFNKLYHEDLQQKIARLWFKKEKMTHEEVEKFLELSEQLHDKIDTLDIQTVVNAVTDAYNKQHSENEVKKAVTTDDKSNPR